MRKDALIVLIFASLLVVPFVYASEVTRSISSTTVEQDETFDVTLTISATGEDESFAIEEVYDDSAFSIYNNQDGGGSENVTGHLKWIVCGQCDLIQDNDCYVLNASGVYEFCGCCLETVDGTTYTYTLQAVSVTGTRDFSGEYMFDSMSTEATITGDDSVTVQCIPSTEVCDGTDNDCDTSVDEGCNDDGDDYCNLSMTTIGTPAVCPSGGGDCNDGDSSINPAADEVCDYIDHNCDGWVYYNTIPGDITQSCGNNTGQCVSGTQTCQPGGVWGACEWGTPPSTEMCDGDDDDCDGIIDNVNGGTSVETTHCQCFDGGAPLDSEICGNNIDDDCNADVDIDGCYCEPGVEQLCDLQDGVCSGSVEVCQPDETFHGCDSSVYLAHNSRYEEDTEETCDGYDNDCDGETDEGLTTRYYEDADGDGYGSQSSYRDECSLPGGYVSNQEDCDDDTSNDPSGCPPLSSGCDDSTSLCAVCRNPDANEICDGVDNDCDDRNDYVNTLGDLGCTGVSIEYDYYDGSTTDLANIADSTNIPGLVLEKTEFGMIEFLDVVNISYSISLNPPATDIKFNLADVNSISRPFLNLPARISLYNLTFLNPVVLRDDQECPSSVCTIIDYTDGDLVFSVTGFSVYSATGTCSDGTLYGKCSSTRPRYCLNGTLVNRAGTCGCPSGLVRDGNNCVDEDDGGGGGGGGGPNCDESDPPIPCERSGVCKPSFQTCVNGFWSSCQGPDPEPEVCDGLDNDCDGEVDEGLECPCLLGEQRPCGPDTEMGECSFGTSVCTSLGAWGECSGAVHPSTELCDDLDNDCDGEVDEGCSSEICQEGLISSPCVCNEEVRYSGYCCQGVFFTDECPGYPFSIFIYAGLIILICVFIYLFTDNGTRIKPYIEQLFR